MDKIITLTGDADPRHLRILEDAINGHLNEHPELVREMEAEFETRLLNLMLYGTTNPRGGDAM